MDWKDILGKAVKDTVSSVKDGLEQLSKDADIHLSIAEKKQKLVQIKQELDTIVRSREELNEKIEGTKERIRNLKADIARFGSASAGVASHLAEKRAALEEVLRRDRERLGQLTSMMQEGRGVLERMQQQAQDEQHSWTQERRLAKARVCLENILRDPIYAAGQSMHATELATLTRLKDESSAEVDLATDGIRALDAEISRCREDSPEYAVLLQQKVRRETVFRSCKAHNRTLEELCSQAGAESQSRGDNKSSPPNESSADPAYKRLKAAAAESMEAIERMRMGMEHGRLAAAEDALGRIRRAGGKAFSRPVKNTESNWFFCAAVGTEDSGLDSESVGLALEEVALRAGASVLQHVSDLDGSLGLCEGAAIGRLVKANGSLEKADRLLLEASADLTLRFDAYDFGKCQKRAYDNGAPVTQSVENEYELVSGMEACIAAHLNPED
jgi:hypothetical protein